MIKSFVTSQDDVDLLSSQFFHFQINNYFGILEYIYTIWLTLLYVIFFIDIVFKYNIF